jgi:hypothetical protein
MFYTARTADSLFFMGFPIHVVLSAIIRNKRALLEIPRKAALASLFFAFADMK